MNLDEKLYLGSEHVKNELTKKLSGDLESIGYKRLQRQLIQRKLQKTSFLLLSLIAVLHYIYFGTFKLSSFKFMNSHGETQLPTLHFSSQTATQNSPFGLFIDDHKRWHIYYQCRACSLGRQCTSDILIDTSVPVSGIDCTSWCHATSSDLYTWSMQPIVGHDEGYDTWGGSAVIDKNNTSGFFPNQKNGVVIVYTQNHLETRTVEQAIAYSIDGGHTFTKSAENHILRFSDGNQDLRNPKVIWHGPTQRWIMTAGKGNSTTIGIHTSPDLIHWSPASEFIVPDLGDLGHGLESPSLVPIPRLNSTGARNKNRPTVPGGTVQDYGDYLLLVSSSGGSPLNGGSVTRYFPGKFNGTRFKPINSRTDRFIDFGPDNYATQFFFGFPVGSPVVSLGLATNLDYTAPLPANSKLHKNSIFTGPREGYLIYGPGEGDLSYFSRPVGLDSLRGETIANFSTQQLRDRSVYYNGSEAVLIEARLEMQPPDDEVVELNWDLVFTSSKTSEYVMCTTVFRTWAADFGCARNQAISKLPADNSLLNQMSIREVRPLLPFHNPAVRRWEVQVVMDRSILEVYLNDGVAAGTITFASEFPIDSVRFQSSEIPDWAALSVTVQVLRPEQSTRLPK